MKGGTSNPDALFERMALTPRSSSSSGSKSPRNVKSPRPSVDGEGWKDKGGGGHCIACADKLPSGSILSKWANTIQKARAAGQFSCSLGILEEGQEYERAVNGFRLSMHSPLESVDIDEWRREHGVNFVIHVPINKELLTIGQHPQYPLHYATFGYLLAAWYVPHAADMSYFEKNSLSFSESAIRNLLTEFDKKYTLAREIGQLECVLMTLGGSDFTSFEKQTTQGIRIEHIMHEKYGPVREWATVRSVKLIIKIPNNPYTEGLYYGETSLCLFGHLVASWEFPVTQIELK